jgi:hypothetical protein
MSLLDLVVEQSAHLTEAAKNGGEVRELVQQTTDRTVGAQKAILDFAAKQSI